MDQGTIRTRVLIADARNDVREALSALLDTTDDFVVIGEAASMREAAAGAETLCPDIVVLDPDGRYDEDALARLAACPVRLVLLTLKAGFACRNRARAMGALVIDKGTSPEELLNLLRRACPGRGAALCPISR
jgi:DNA-binding NarL/FixJ family response regulator